MPLHRPITTWRDWYNPLKGLTMSRIVSMEDAAERGQPSDLQWFWQHMERTDVTVQAAIARRLSFLDSIDWEVRPVESADPMLAAEQIIVPSAAMRRPILTRWGARSGSESGTSCAISAC